VGAAEVAEQVHPRPRAVRRPGVGVHRAHHLRSMGSMWSCKNAEVLVRVAPGELQDLGDYPLLGLRAATNSLGRESRDAR
jgi:hypothetical protein